MSQQRKVREAVQKMAGTYLKDYASFIDCEVISIDMDNRLCDCKAIGGDSDFDVPSVQLMPEPNDGQLIVPKIGSAVRVGITQRNEPFVVMFSEIDTVYMVAETLYQFNDGSLGGLVKVQELTDKINALENQINDILQVLSTTSIPLAPSGTYPFAPLYASILPILPITIKEDLENILITHGE